MSYKLPTAKTIVSTLGSIAGAAMVIRSVVNNYLPPEFKNYLYLSIRIFINKFSAHLTIVLYESEGFHDNEMYTATELYIATKMSTEIHRLKVSKNPNQKEIAVAMEINEEFTDVYKGVRLYWCLVSKKSPSRECYSHDGMSRTRSSDQRSMELTFHRKHRDFVFNDYFPFLVKEAEKRIQKQKTVKLFPRTLTRWQWILM